MVKAEAKCKGSLGLFNKQFSCLLCVTSLYFSLTRLIVSLLVVLVLSYQINKQKKQEFPFLDVTQLPIQLHIQTSL